MNIDQTNPDIFKFYPYVKFLKDFQYKTFRDVLCLQISLTWSIFEQEMCSFFLNRSEFWELIRAMCWPTMEGAPFKIKKVSKKSLGISVKAMRHMFKTL